MEVRFSALRTRRTLLSRNIIIFLFLVLISVRGSVYQPQGLVQLEELVKLKKFIHLIGSRTRYLRLVAQCLNRYATVSSPINWPKKSMFIYEYIYLCIYLLLRLSRLFVSLKFTCCVNMPWVSVGWPRDTLYPLSLALTSPMNGSCSVGIYRSRTKATRFLFFIITPNLRGIPSPSFAGIFFF
jgi:hypothetical protein